MLESTFMASWFTSLLDWLNTAIVAPAGTVFAAGWEVSLIVWLQEHLGSTLSYLISFLSGFGEEVILVLLLGFFYWGYNKKLGEMLGLNIVVGLLWSPMLKNVVLRSRPYIAHEAIQDPARKVDPKASAGDTVAQGYSFPSGHCTNTVTAYGTLAVHEKDSLRESKRKRLLYALALGLSLLVGLARVISGNHYLTDVLAAWGVGLLCVLAVSLLRRAIKNDLAFYAVLAATVVPGVFFCTTKDYFSSLGLFFGFVIALLFEKRFVKFENTTNLWRCALRTLGGAALFAALKFGADALKLFPVGTNGEMAFRCVRYAIIVFVEFGLYPLLFRHTKKWFEKKS